MLAAARTPVRTMPAAKGARRVGTTFLWVLDGGLSITVTSVPFEIVRWPVVQGLPSPMYLPRVYTQSVPRKPPAYQGRERPRTSNEGNAFAQRPFCQSLHRCRSGYRHARHRYWEHLA